MKCTNQLIGNKNYEVDTKGSKDPNQWVFTDVATNVSYTGIQELIAKDTEVATLKSTITDEKEFAYKLISQELTDNTKAVLPALASIDQAFSTQAPLDTKSEAILDNAIQNYESKRNLLEGGFEVFSNNSNEYNAFHATAVLLADDIRKGNNVNSEIKDFITSLTALKTSNEYSDNVVKAALVTLLGKDAIKNAVDSLANSSFTGPGINTPVNTGNVGQGWNTEPDSFEPFSFQGYSIQKSKSKVLDPNIIPTEFYGITTGLDGTPLGMATFVTWDSNEGAYYLNKVDFSNVKDKEQVNKLAIDVINKSMAFVTAAYDNFAKAKLVNTANDGEAIVHTYSSNIDDSKITQELSNSKKELQSKLFSLSKEINNTTNLLIDNNKKDLESNDFKDIAGYNINTKKFGEKFQGNGEFFLVYNKNYNELFNFHKVSKFDKQEKSNRYSIQYRETTPSGDKLIHDLGVVRKDYDTDVSDNRLFNDSIDYTKLEKMIALKTNNYSLDEVSMGNTLATRGFFRPPVVPSAFTDNLQPLSTRQQEWEQEGYIVSKIYTYSDTGKLVSYAKGTLNSTAEAQSRLKGRAFVVRARKIDGDPIYGSNDSLDKYLNNVIEKSQKVNSTSGNTAEIEEGLFHNLNAEFILLNTQQEGVDFSTYTNVIDKLYKANGKSDTISIDNNIKTEEEMMRVIIGSQLKSIHNKLDGSHIFSGKWNGQYVPGDKANVVGDASNTIGTGTLKIQPNHKYYKLDFANPSASGQAPSANVQMAEKLFSKLFTSQRDGRSIQGNIFNILENSIIDKKYIVNTPTGRGFSIAIQDQVGVDAMNIGKALDIINNGTTAEARQLKGEFVIPIGVLKPEIKTNFNSYPDNVKQDILKTLALYNNMAYNEDVDNYNLQKQVGKSRKNAKDASWKFAGKFAMIDLINNLKNNSVITQDVIDNNFHNLAITFPPLPTVFNKAIIRPLESSAYKKSLNGETSVANLLGLNDKYYVADIKDAVAMNLNVNFEQTLGFNNPVQLTQLKNFQAPSPKKTVSPSTQPQSTQQSTQTTPSQTTPPVAPTFNNTVSPITSGAKRVINGLKGSANDFIDKLAKYMKPSNVTQAADEEFYNATVNKNKETITASEFFNNVNTPTEFKSIMLEITDSVDGDIIKKALNNSNHIIKKVTGRGNTVVLTVTGNIFNGRLYIDNPLSTTVNTLDDLDSSMSLSNKPTPITLVNHDIDHEQRIVYNKERRNVNFSLTPQEAKRIIDQRFGYRNRAKYLKFVPQTKQLDDILGYVSNKGLFLTINDQQLIDDFTVYHETIHLSMLMLEPDTRHKILKQAISYFGLDSKLDVVNNPVDADFVEEVLAKKYPEIMGNFKPSTRQHIMARLPRTLREWFMFFRDMLDSLKSIFVRNTTSTLETYLERLDAGIFSDFEIHSPFSNSRIMYNRATKASSRELYNELNRAFSVNAIYDFDNKTIDTTNYSVTENVDLEYIAKTYVEAELYKRMFSKANNGSGDSLTFENAIEDLIRDYTNTTVGVSGTGKIGNNNSNEDYIKAVLVTPLMFNLSGGRIIKKTPIEIIAEEKLGVFKNKEDHSTEGEGEDTAEDNGMNYADSHLAERKFKFSDLTKKHIAITPLYTIDRANNVITSSKRSELFVDPIDAMAILEKAYLSAKKEVGYSDLNFEAVGKQLLSIAKVNKNSINSRTAYSLYLKFFRNPNSSNDFSNYIVGENIPKSFVEIMNTEETNADGDITGTFLKNNVTKALSSIHKDLQSIVYESSVDFSTSGYRKKTDANFDKTGNNLASNQVKSDLAASMYEPDGTLNPVLGSFLDTNGITVSNIDVRSTNDGSNEYEIQLSKKEDEDMYINIGTVTVKGAKRDGTFSPDNVTTNLSNNTQPIVDFLTSILNRNAQHSESAQKVAAELAADVVAKYTLSYIEDALTGKGKQSDSNFFDSVNTILDKNKFDKELFSKSLPKESLTMLFSKEGTKGDKARRTVAGYKFVNNYISATGVNRIDTVRPNTYNEKGNKVSLKNNSNNMFRRFADYEAAIGGSDSALRTLTEKYKGNILVNGGLQLKEISKINLTNGKSTIQMSSEDLSSLLLRTMVADVNKYMSLSNKDEATFSYMMTTNSNKKSQHLYTIGAKLGESDLLWISNSDKNTPQYKERLRAAHNVFKSYFYYETIPNYLQAMALNPQVRTLMENKKLSNGKDVFTYLREELRNHNTEDIDNTENIASVLYTEVIKDFNDALNTVFENDFGKITKFLESTPLHQGVDFVLDKNNKTFSIPSQGITNGVLNVSSIKEEAKIGDFISMSDAQFDEYVQGLITKEKSRLNKIIIQRGSAGLQVDHYGNQFKIRKEIDEEQEEYTKRVKEQFVEDALLNNYINSISVDQLVASNPIYFGKGAVEASKRMINNKTAAVAPDTRNKRGIGKTVNSVVINDLVMKGDDVSWDNDTQNSLSDNLVHDDSDIAVVTATGVNPAGTEQNNALAITTPLGRLALKNSFSDDTMIGGAKLGTYGEDKLHKYAMNDMNNFMLESGGQYTANMFKQLLGGNTSPLYRTYVKERYKAFDSKEYAEYRNDLNNYKFDVEFFNNWWMSNKDKTVSEFYNEQSPEEQRLMHREFIDRDGTVIHPSQDTKTVQERYLVNYVVPVSGTKIGVNSVNDSTNKSDWNIETGKASEMNFVLPLTQDVDNPTMAAPSQLNYILTPFGNNFESTKEIYKSLAKLTQNQMDTLDGKFYTTIINNVISNNEGNDILKNKFLELRDKFRSKNSVVRLLAKKEMNEMIDNGSIPYQYIKGMFHEKLFAILTGLETNSVAATMAKAKINADHPLLKSDMLGAISSSIKASSTKRKVKGTRYTVISGDKIFRMVGIRNSDGETIARVDPISAFKIKDAEGDNYVKSYTLFKDEDGKDVLVENFTEDTSRLVEENLAMGRSVDNFNHLKITEKYEKLGYNIQFNNMDYNKLEGNPSMDEQSVVIPIYEGNGLSISVDRGKSITDVSYSKDAEQRELRIQFVISWLKATKEAPYNEKAQEYVNKYHKYISVSPMEIGISRDYLSDFNIPANVELAEILHSPNGNERENVTEKLYSYITDALEQNVKPLSDALDFVESQPDEVMSFHDLAVIDKRIDNIIKDSNSQAFKKAQAVRVVLNNIKKENPSDFIEDLNGRDIVVLEEDNQVFEPFVYNRDYHSAILNGDVTPKDIIEHNVEGIKVYAKKDEKPYIGYSHVLRDETQAYLTTVNSDKDTISEKEIEEAVGKEVYENIRATAADINVTTKKVVMFDTLETDDDGNPIIETREIIEPSTENGRTPLNNLLREFLEVASVPKQKRETIYDDFKKALDVQSIRIPITGYNSIQSSKVAFFFDGQANSIVVPSFLLITSGADNDGDQISLHMRPSENDRSNSAKSFREIFDAVNSRLKDSRNFIRSVDPIGTSYIASELKPSEKSSMLKNMLLSNVQVNTNNQAGNATIGVVVKFAQTMNSHIVMNKSKKEAGDFLTRFADIDFFGKKYKSMLGGRTETINGKKHIIKDKDIYGDTVKQDIETHTSGTGALVTGNKISDTHQELASKLGSSEAADMALFIIAVRQALTDKVWPDGSTISFLDQYKLSKSVTEFDENSTDVIPFTLHEAAQRLAVATPNRRYLLKNPNGKEVTIDQITLGTLEMPGYKFKVSNKKDDTGKVRIYNEIALPMTKLTDEISQASLDNAKEAMLAKLGITDNTWSLMEGAMFMKMDGHDMFEILTHPYTKELVKKVEKANSVYSQNKWRKRFSSAIVDELKSIGASAGTRKVYEYEPEAAKKIFKDVLNSTNLNGAELSSILKDRVNENIGLLSSIQSFQNMSEEDISARVSSIVDSVVNTFNDTQISREVENNFADLKVRLDEVTEELEEIKTQGFNGTTEEIDSQMQRFQELTDEQQSLNERIESQEDATKKAIKESTQTFNNAIDQLNLPQGMLAKMLADIAFHRVLANTKEETRFKENGDKYWYTDEQALKEIYDSLPVDNKKPFSAIPNQELLQVVKNAYTDINQNSYVNAIKEKASSLSKKAAIKEFKTNGKSFDLMLSPAYDNDGNAIISKDKDGEERLLFNNHKHYFLERLQAITNLGEAIEEQREIVNLTTTGVQSRPIVNEIFINKQAKKLGYWGGDTFESLKNIKENLIPLTGNESKEMAVENLLLRKAIPNDLEKLTENDMKLINEEAKRLRKERRIKITKSIEVFDDEVINHRQLFADNPAIHEVIKSFEKDFDYKQKYTIGREKHLVGVKQVIQNLKRDNMTEDAGMLYSKEESRLHEGMFFGAMYLKEGYVADKNTPEMVPFPELVSDISKYEKRNASIDVTQLYQGVEGLQEFMSNAKSQKGTRETMLFNAAKSDLSTLTGRKQFIDNMNNYFKIKVSEIKADKQTEYESYLKYFKIFTASTGEQRIVLNRNEEIDNEGKLVIAKNLSNMSLEVNDNASIESDLFYRMLSKYAMLTTGLDRRKGSIADALNIDTNLDFSNYLDSYKDFLAKNRDNAELVNIINSKYFRDITVNTPELLPDFLLTPFEAEKKQYDPDTNEVIERDEEEIQGRQEELDMEIEQMFVPNYKEDTYTGENTIVGYDFVPGVDVMVLSPRRLSLLNGFTEKIEGTRSINSHKLPKYINVTFNGGEDSEVGIPKIHKAVYKKVTVDSKTPEGQEFQVDLYVMQKSVSNNTINAYTANTDKNVEHNVSDGLVIDTREDNSSEAKDFIQEFINKLDEEKQTMLTEMEDARKGNSFAKIVSRYDEVSKTSNKGDSMNTLVIRDDKGKEFVKFTEVLNEDYVKNNGIYASDILKTCK